MNETQQFIAAEKLLKDLLPDCNEKSLDYAHMNRILMGIYERTGRSYRAAECAKVEFDIFTEHFSPDQNDLANAYSDMGYSLCSAFKPSDALFYLNKAVDMAKSHPEPKRYTHFNIDRFLRNRGRTKQQLRRFKEALEDFAEAEYYQPKIHGDDSHYDGE